MVKVNDVMGALNWLGQVNLKHLIKMHKRLFLLSLVSLSLSFCKSSQTNQETPKHPAASSSNTAETPSNVNQPEMPPPLENAIWSRYDEKDLPDLERRIQPKEYTLWLCDYAALLQMLEELPVELTLPVDGAPQLFILRDAGTMAPTLAEKFPELKSLKGESADGSIEARVDTNTEGLFAEFNYHNKKFILSPLLKGSKVYYALYSEDNIQKQPRDEDFD